MTTTKKTPSGASLSLGWLPGDTPAFKGRAGRARQARAGKVRLSALRSLTALSRARSPSSYAGSLGSGAAKASRFGSGRLAGSRGFRPANMQRVVVKTYIGKTTSARGVKAAAAHVGYIGREGAGEGGGRAVAFDGEGDLTRDQVADFRDDMVHDRHHFRVMVSPENGGRLDLKEYAREVVHQMESDLGSRLDWLGVVHANTDNPHVHLVIRGVTDKGGDLVISRQYLSHGMRHAAEDLATSRLGYRTAQEIEQSLKRDLTAERFTAVDRQLLVRAGASEDGILHTGGLSDGQHDRGGPIRNNLITRLHYLERSGLAAEVGPGVWQLDEQLEKNLRGLSTRRDIVKQVQALAAGRENNLNVVVFNKETPLGQAVVGRVIARGDVDELSDRRFVGVSATDGQIYYVPLSAYSERPGFEASPGSIVSVSVVSPARATAADANIEKFARAHGLVYDPAGHKDEVVASRRLPPEASPDEYILAHTKRLDSLSSRGLTTKLPDGRYQIPEDYLARVQDPVAMGMDKGGFVRIDRLSHQDLPQQVQAVGSTWLDQEIAKGGVPKYSQSFGPSRFQAELSDAIRGRLERLQGMGLATAHEGRITPTKNFVNALYEREIAAAQERLRETYGEPHPLGPGSQFAGRLEHIERLSSGPHAVIAEGQRFVLAPVSGNMGAQVGNDLSITLGRAKELSHAVPALQQIPLRYEVVRTQQLGLSL